MHSNIIKYGFIAGSVIILIPVVSEWFMGRGPETFRMGEIIGYSTMILSLLLIFVAVNNYQKAHPNESLSFAQIFLIGIGISAIAGVMFGVYNLVYVYYIAPDFMEQYFSYYVENIRNSGAPQAQIDKQIAQLEQEKEFFMSPWINFAVMFVTVFGIGVIVSLIAGFAQKSKQALPA